MSRDEIKEIIFDNVGWEDREWSHKVGLAGYAILYKIMNMFLSVGQSIILESTFKPVDQRTEEIKKYQKTLDFIPIQIFCYAKEEVLAKRFKERSHSNSRHPGHVDNTNVEDFIDTIKKIKHLKMDLDGEYIEVDTSDFGNIDYSSIDKLIGRYL